MATRNTPPRRDRDGHECVHCHAELPRNARFCSSCGASQTGDSWQECEIIWWRGYVAGEFVAVRIVDGIPAEEVGRSEAFRWLRARPVPPEKRRVVSRLETLGKQLESQGWERTGQGHEWCAHRFRRQLGSSRGSTGLAGAAESSALER